MWSNRLGLSQYLSSVPPGVTCGQKSDSSCTHSLPQPPQRPSACASRLNQGSKTRSSSIPQAAHGLFLHVSVDSSMLSPQTEITTACCLRQVMRPASRTCVQHLLQASHHALSMRSLSDARARMSGRRRQAFSRQAPHPARHWTRVALALAPQPLGIVKTHTVLPTSKWGGAGAQRAAERGDDEQVGQEAAHVAHPKGEVVDAVELPVQRQPRRVSRQRRQRLPRRAEPDCPRARWQPVACRLPPVDGAWARLYDQVRHQPRRISCPRRQRMPGRAQIACALSGSPSPAAC